MIVRVQYRIDAHDYDRRRGTCHTRCTACALEAVPHSSADDADAAQPRAERERVDGDQGSLNPPERRFSVIVEDLFAEV
jgi:hypothetical protein